MYVQYMYNICTYIVQYIHVNLCSAIFNLKTGLIFESLYLLCLFLFWSSVKSMLTLIIMLETKYTVKVFGLNNNIVELLKDVEKSLKSKFLTLIYIKACPILHKL